METSLSIRVQCLCTVPFAFSLTDSTKSRAALFFLIFNEVISYILLNCFVTSYIWVSRDLLNDFCNMYILLGLLFVLQGSVYFDKCITSCIHSYSIRIVSLPYKILLWFTKPLETSDILIIATVFPFVECVWKESCH